MKSNPSPECRYTFTKTSFFRRWKLKALAGFFILALAPAAQAAVINVDTLCQCGFPDDSAGNCATASVSGIPVNCFGLPVGGSGIGGDKDGFCSFGEAIVSAAENEDRDGCSGANVVGPYDPLGDTIVLPSGQTFVFTAPDNFDPDIGPNALPVVEQLLLVEGSGSKLVRDPGPKNDAFMRFFQDDGLLSINKLNFENGNPGCAVKFCGDGIVQGDLGEQCDVKVCSDNNAVCTSDDDCDVGVCVPANVTDGVGCDADCHLESCGNGQLDPGEQCETTGSFCSISGQPCDGGAVCPGATVCIIDGLPTDTECNEDGGDSFCRTQFPNAQIVDCALVTEECLTGENCTNCESTTDNGGLCGNGIIDSGEACDPGSHCFDDLGNDSGDSCTTSASCLREFPNCLPVVGNNCSEFCQFDKCGNGMLDPGEDCDPGGRCSSNGGFCVVGDVLSCPGSGVCAGGSTPCSSPKDCGGDACIITENGICEPQNIGDCNSCLTGAYNECYNAGAILVGSTDFDDGGGSGPSPVPGGHCSLTNKACDPNGPNTCLGTDTQEPNFCVPNTTDNGGGDGPQSAFLEVSHSSFTKNATTTPDATLTDPPTPPNVRSGLAGAILGGILTRVHITDTMFSDNASIVGGAVLGLLNNEFTIARSTFNDNIVVADHALDEGDTAIRSGIGGAVAMALSDIDISESAFFGNLASQDSAFPAQFGGGIASICSEFDLSNTTLFHNEAQLGGGIFAAYGLLNCAIFFGDLELPGDEGDPFSQLFISRVLDSEMRIANSTLTENIASEEGGGLHVMLDTSSKVRLQETILSSNLLTAVSGTSGPNCEGSFTSEDYNLVGDLTGCSFLAASHDLLGDPALLACTTLADDATPGHQFCKPSPISLANDTGGPTCTSFDQIAVDRYGTDGTCDIGAIEANNVLCGNAIRELPGESCDDGGRCNGDPTASLCTTFNADTVCGGAPCLPINGDGCNISCILESCGNGVVDDGEQCDDGKTCSGTSTSCSSDTDCGGAPGSCAYHNGDGCNNACIDEFCGDGIVNDGAGAENCDDGNHVDNDNCGNDCQAPVCDDGVIEGNEECETSDTLPAGCFCHPVSCELECTGGGGETQPFCDHDGVPEVGEECDDGLNGNNDNCTNECLLNVCGDGFRQFGVEECDDHNQSNGDGCSDTCEAESCGDGIKQASEQCEDGNTVNGDGCSEFCQKESCGDGILDLDGPDGPSGANTTADDEQCDDGNQSSGDGCSFDCFLESCGDGFVDPGEECDDANFDTDDDCVYCRFAQCGDDFIHTVDGGLTGDDPLETCDDGAQSSGDGCSETCQVETRCGDGNVDAGDGEECDDGNTNSLDGCNGLCQNEDCGDGIIEIALGEQCEPPSSGSCDEDCHVIVPFSCGDGVVTPNGPDGDPSTAGDNEQCEDGNTNPFDSCAFCKNNVCGDNFINPGVEGCDDGNHVDGDGCSANCELESCGDGAVQSGEECEDGVTTLPDDSFQCINCTIVDTSKCRDGQHDPGEQCDDDNAVNTDACTNACTLPICGDGITSPNGADGAVGGGDDEQCDDGNTNAFDACTTSCKTNVCGDGFRQFGVEECDDGNTNDGDGCSEICNNEVACGNGVVQVGLGEECDDGNGINDDFCSNACQRPFCGDNVTAGAEDCDDGNHNAFDNCKNDCSFNVCGDGIPQTGEDGEPCDDGNGINNDGCSDNCVEAECGDGTVQILAGEECDPSEEDPETLPNGCFCSQHCEVECGDTAEPFCGDGVVNGHEECDDLNNNDHDLCTNHCTNAVCGDDIVGPGEECDDGDSDMDDGCKNDCTLNVCRDGVLFAGVEQCDDGNIANGDGCHFDCTEEHLLTPTPTPTQQGAPTPTPTQQEGAVCGDGTIDAGEECDGGEAHNSDTTPDACRTDCMDAHCGDNVVDTGEECDGNRPDCTVRCVVDACAQIARDAATAITNDKLLEFIKKYDVDIDLNTLHGTGRSRRVEFQDCALLFTCGGGTCKADSVKITPVSVNSINAGCSLVRDRDPSDAATRATLLSILMMAPGALLLPSTRRRWARVAVRRGRK